MHRILVATLLIASLACGGGGGPSGPSRQVPLFEATDWAGLPGDVDHVAVTSIETASAFRYPPHVSGVIALDALKITAEHLGFGWIEALDTRGEVSDTLAVAVYPPYGVPEPRINPDEVPKTIPIDGNVEISVEGECLADLCAVFVVPRSTRGRCAGAGQFPDTSYFCNTVGSSGGESAKRGSFVLTSLVKCHPDFAGVKIESFVLFVRDHKRRLPERESEAEVVVTSHCGT